MKCTARCGVRVYVDSQKHRLSSLLRKPYSDHMYKVIYQMIKTRRIHGIMIGIMTYVSMQEIYDKRILVTDQGTIIYFGSVQSRHRERLPVINFT